MTGALTGKVLDQEDTSIPGVMIRISSPALIGGPRLSPSDEQGRFRFSDLPPGSYEITATLGGFKTFLMKDIRVSIGMTVEIPVEMILYGASQEVEVQGETQNLDPASSSLPTVLPKEFLKNMPADRDTSHIMNFAPGINNESAYGGPEESGNAYQLDGVDISDPQGGSPWAFFNYSLIDEVELIGLGAPAEYGEFTGAVFNTVTKSGGNQFSGSTEFFYSDKSLTATNSEFIGLSPAIEKHLEQTLQLGGPILNDRLWYFGSAQYVHDRASEGGPVETQKDPRGFLKLTWQTARNSTLAGWVEWAHTKVTGRDADAFTPIEATTQEDNPEVLGNLSYKSQLSENTVLNIAYGGYSGNHHFNPQSGFSIPGHEDAQTGFKSQNAPEFGIVERTRNQLNASFAYHMKNLISGYHDFKFGTEIERSVIRDRFGPPGGVFLIDNEGPEEDPSTEEDDLFTLAMIGGGFDAHGRNQRLSFYAQDAWHITSNVTFNPGLRLDLNRGRVSDGQTIFKTHGLAPRLGFAWDVSGEGRSILRAHYGRYYEAMYAGFYYYTDPGAFFPLTVQRIFNTSGFRETIFQDNGQKYAMDPNIKHPSLDQYVLSFDQQGPYGIVLSGAFISRRNKNLIETVSRDGMFVPVTGIVPDTGQQVTLFDYLNPGTDTLIYTNPEGLNRTYRAGMFTATRRFSRNWQLLASYVFSKSRGNIDNLGFDETGGGGNVPFFEGHFLDTPNSLVNAQGRLTHDQTHQIKLQGTYIIPSVPVSLSVAYTYHSGDTWTPTNDCLLTDDGNGISGDGILDCHEFPQGPVVYFAEPRGSRRLPARNDVDLHLEWAPALNQLQLRLFADIFNLTNQSRPIDVEPMIGEEFGNPANLNFPRNLRFGVAFEW
jgi:hypothetical protein